MSRNRKQQRSNRGFACTTSRLDEDIAKLEQERTALLRRRPPRLTHATEPTFGSVSGGGGSLVGAMAYKGEKPLPRSAPHWKWSRVATPTPLTHQPPNLFGSFREDHLPTPRNMWSTAQRSMSNPLKTLLMDDAKRNIPRHATRSQLLSSRKRTNIPHMSFDVDMDGVVSELDMKYAKAFDLDGDGILNKDERALLRHAMAKDMYQDHKVVHNLSETPITDEDLEAKALKLAHSTNFTEDFNRLHQKQQRSNIAGATGGISAIQQHYRFKENRDYGLGTDHNATSVKTHNHGYLSPEGIRQRCISRSQLLEQRRIDFRETAKLAAFKPDGKELLFRRKADTSIQPTPV